MKTRESGMPNQNMWEKFFDAEKILPRKAPALCL